MYEDWSTDSLLVPIFRLYCFQNGQYAALLPLLCLLAACCYLLLPAAAWGPGCCSLLLPAAGAAAGGCCCCCCGAAAIKQPPKQETNSQTPFSNTSETAKHHLISCPKRSKGTPKKGLTSLLKPYYKIATLPADCWLAGPGLLPLLLPAGVCCCLQLPAAACSCLPAAPLLLPAAGVLLLVAAAAATVVLLWCCCGAAAIKQPPKQETNSQTPFSKHIRNSKTPPNFVPKT